MRWLFWSLLKESLDNSICLVCVHWNLGKMTKKEADRALAEMIDENSDEYTLQHTQEVSQKIKEESKD